MKTHIKVLDQKKRAALESRAGTPSSLRTRSPSVEFLSSTHNETSPLNSTRKSQFPGQRQVTGTPIQRSLSTQSLDRHYPPAVPSPSPRDATMQDRSTPTSARLSTRPPVSPITKQPVRNAAWKDHYRPTHGANDQRTLHSVGKSEPSTSDNLNGNVSTLLDSYNKPGDVKNRVTTRSSSGEERLMRTYNQHEINNTSEPIRHADGVPSLDLTGVQYSHRGPASIRTSDSTDFKANVWEEEQQYLKFISDVTIDILARGIFSNRVLKQVFEMHIERRKDYLDESRLREMIEQLKEDLGITDS